MEPEGLVPSRRKEQTWLEDTEPHQGARRRMMEFDRSVDGELGAASGGVEDEDSLRDDVVPELQILTLTSPGSLQLVPVTRIDKCKFNTRRR